MPWTWDVDEETKIFAARDRNGKIVRKPDGKPKAVIVWRRFLNLTFGNGKTTAIVSFKMTKYKGRVYITDSRDSKHIMRDEFTSEVRRMLKDDAENAIAAFTVSV